MRNLAVLSLRRVSVLSITWMFSVWNQIWPLWNLSSSGRQEMCVTHTCGWSNLFTVPFFGIAFLYIFSYLKWLSRSIQRTGINMFIGNSMLYWSYRSFWAIIDSTDFYGKKGTARWREEGQVRQPVSNPRRPGWSRVTQMSLQRPTTQKHTFITYNLWAHISRSDRHLEM